MGARWFRGSRVEQPCVRIGRVLVMLPVLLTGCAGTPAATPALRQTSEAVVLGAGTWRFFPINGYLEGLVRAKNGNLWAAAAAYPTIHSLSRITPDGRVTTHTIAVYPQELAIDESGNFWSTTARNEEQIAEIRRRHFRSKTFALSSDAYGAIIAGRDGDIWFTESFAVGKITMSGVLTEYVTPEIGGESGMAWAARKVWFFLTSGLASIDSKNGALTTYNTPYEANQGAMVAASDGAIWFFGEAQRRQVLVRFDPALNEASAYELPEDFGVPSTPGNLIQTSDGALWIGAQHIVGKKIRHQRGAGLVRFDTQSKTFTAFKAPKSYGWPWNLAVGPAGSIWATAAGGVYELKPQ